METRHWVKYSLKQPLNIFRRPRKQIISYLLSSIRSAGPKTLSENRFANFFYEVITDVSMPTASSLSELSSLHEGGTSDFRHTYQTVQMKALPPIADHDDQSVLRVAPPTQSRRLRRDRGNHSDDELDRRYNHGVAECMYVLS